MGTLLLGCQFLGSLIKGSNHDLINGSASMANRFWAFSSHILCWAKNQPASPARNGRIVIFFSQQSSLRTGEDLKAPDGSYAE